MTSRPFCAGVLALLGLAVPGTALAAQCGSALLLEVAAPAVFAGLDPSSAIVARFWEAGSGGTNYQECRLPGRLRYRLRAALRRWQRLPGAERSQLAQRLPSRTRTARPRAPSPVLVTTR